MGIIAETGDQGGGAAGVALTVISAPPASAAA